MFHNNYLTIFVFLLNLSGLAAEAAVVPLWIKHKSFFYPALLHLDAVILFGLAFILGAQKKDVPQTSAVCFFALLCIIFFPCLGIIMAVAVCFFVSKYSQHPEKKNYRNIRTPGKRIRNKVDFNSFMNIINQDDEKTRPAMIGRLSGNISSDAVNLLKQSVHDSSAKIRLNAVNALLKTENIMNDKIQSAVKLILQERTAINFFNLGNLYSQYISSGLMGEISCGEYRLAACEAYERSLKLDSGRKEVVVNYARCLIDLEKYEKAEAFLNCSAQTWPNDKQIVLLKSEVSFCQGRLNRIAKNLSRVFYKGNSLTQEEKELIEFWAD